MADVGGRLPVLNLAESLGLYSDLLEQSKGTDQLARLLRDRILDTLASRRITQVEAGGYEAERQLRHHEPQLNEERAAEILREHGRLEECQVVRLDEERAREAIEQLFQHGALSKDELPFIYVKPTEALVVRPVEAGVEAAERVLKARRPAA